MAALITGLVVIARCVSTREDYIRVSGLVSCPNSHSISSTVTSAVTGIICCRALRASSKNYAPTMSPTSEESNVVIQMDS